MPEMLIIMTSPLRDIAHGLQVAASIKAQKPEWRISWIVRDIFAPLVRSSSAVDRVFVFQRYEGARGFLRMMREVRKHEFDLVCDFQGLLRTGLMTKWARGLRKVGRTDSREGSGFFYQQRSPLPAEGRQAHLLDIMLQFCTVAGAEPRLTGPLHFRDLERLNLSFMDPRKGQRPILIFPDSGQHSKKWNGFSQLTAMLIREGGRKVVWAGSHYLPCKESFPEGAFVNLTGNTSLTSLPALLAKADWVISNDSGPMHLSAAMGLKTIGLFGPTDPRRFGPYPVKSPTNYAIQAPVGDLANLSAKEVYYLFNRIEASLQRSQAKAAMAHVS
ncbi:glycosyltransferase family 9 protein [Oleiharenicola lentus]|jgi:ADP-heptose:LPS heptosyltransferase|uniref:Glycosyltransferase family 9 protein n=1 Tax=Oleiharenicola lentus TaxID=2508720 RepID=A0A4Q1CAV6_9BACT|nr:glycosyltransferase family 9 protein [Oleiharenicola lentus]RXK56036.1 glycosyltransferase family 9 protein [Oleiharenicola lentus]